MYWTDAKIPRRDIFKNHGRVAPQTIFHFLFSFPFSFLIFGFSSWSFIQYSAHVSQISKLSEYCQKSAVCVAVSLHPAISHNIFISIQFYFAPIPKYSHCLFFRSMLHTPNPVCVSVSILFQVLRIFRFWCLPML